MEYDFMINDLDVEMCLQPNYPDGTSKRLHMFDEPLLMSFRIGLECNYCSNFYPEHSQRFDCISVKQFFTICIKNNFALPLVDNNNISFETCECFIGMHLKLLDKINELALRVVENFLYVCSKGEQGFKLFYHDQRGLHLLMIDGKEKCLERFQNYLLLQ